MIKKPPQDGGRQLLERDHHEGATKNPRGGSSRGGTEGAEGDRNPPPATQAAHRGGGNTPGAHGDQGKKPSQRQTRETNHSDPAGGRTRRRAHRQPPGGNRGKSPNGAESGKAGNNNPMFT